MAMAIDGDGDGDGAMRCDAYVALLFPPFLLYR
jgi:hypothetical protein